MKKFFFYPLALSFAIPIVRAAAQSADAPAPKHRCQLELVDKSVTNSGALNIPKAQAENVDLENDPMVGNPLCQDQVWRFLDKYDKYLKSGRGVGAHLQRVSRADGTFFTLDQKVALAAQAAAAVYEQAKVLDLISVAAKPIEFGPLKRKADVQEASPKDAAITVSSENIAHYEDAIQSLVQQKDPNSDEMAPGPKIQAFYDALLDLRAALGEAMGDWEIAGGLAGGRLAKGQTKTLDQMADMMDGIAACDLRRRDVEEGKALNCWRNARKRGKLGDFDVLAQNIVASHFAQTSYVFLRVKYLVSGADHKRSLKAYLAGLGKYRDQLRDFKLIAINKEAFAKLGANLFGDKLGIDDLRNAWESHKNDGTWLKNNAAVKAAIDAVDQMTGAQSTTYENKPALSFNRKKEGAEAFVIKQIDVLDLKPEEINSVADEVADSLLNNSTLGAQLKAAKEAILPTIPKHEDTAPAPVNNAPKPEAQPAAPKTTKAAKKHKTSQGVATAPAAEPYPEAKPSFFDKLMHTDAEAYMQAQARALQQISAQNAAARVQIRDKYEAKVNEIAGNTALGKQARKEQTAMAKQEEAKELAAVSARLTATHIRDNRQISEIYNKKILGYINPIMLSYMKAGRRYPVLAMAEHSVGVDPGDDVIKKYFEDNWLSDQAREPLKSALVACQKAHGFSSQASGDFPSPNNGSYGYKDPTEDSVNEHCVLKGLVNFVTAPKGKSTTVKSPKRRAPVN